MTTTVRNIEAEVENSGNSFNIVFVEQSSALAVGMFAIAIALTGINGDSPSSQQMIDSMRQVMNEALEADKKNREQFLEAIQAMKKN